jgi:hypothetical protein
MTHLLAYFIFTSLISFWSLPGTFQSLLPQILHFFDHILKSFWHCRRTFWPDGPSSPATSSYARHASAQMPNAGV